MERLTAYIGRDNEERLQLLQNGSLVAESAVTRAVLRASSFCIDTVDDPTLIYFDANNTILCVKAGLIPGIVAKRLYVGNITIWDANTTVGYACDSVEIYIQEWNVCEVS